MGQKGESLAEKTGFPEVKNWFVRNAKLLVVCFAVGMVCHAQMYLNGLSNPDAVVSLSNPNGYGSFIPHAWDISLGRWGLLFAACAKFGLCSPILTSAITIALFTLGIVALIDKLGIKRACLRYAFRFCSSLRPSFPAASRTTTARIHTRSRFYARCWPHA